MASVSPSPPTRPAQVAVDRLDAEDALPSEEVLHPLRGLRDAVRGGLKRPERVRRKDGLVAL